MTTGLSCTFLPRIMRWPLLLFPCRPQSCILCQMRTHGHQCDHPGGWRWSRAWRHSAQGTEQDPCQDPPSVPQVPSHIRTRPTEGGDAAARVGPQLSVEPTHVDSGSALQVDECFLDALENNLQPRRRRFRRVHSGSENVAQWGKEGRFAVSTSEPEEVRPMSRRPQFRHRPKL